MDNNAGKLFLCSDPPIPNVANLTAIDILCTESPTPPTAYDSCDGVIVGVPDIIFPTNVLGIHNVTWTYTDGSGNSTSQVQTITILPEYPVPAAWIQIGQDIFGPAANDEFGKSVSISDDGSIIAIGAPYNDFGAYNAGAVRVYQNIGGLWYQLGSDIYGAGAADRFGWTVSLNSDGTRLAIGAPYNWTANGSTGHVRVYEFVAGNWVQLGANIDGINSGDQFGSSVSLNADGTILAIGAPASNSFFGYTKVFEFTGGNWLQVGAQIDGEASGDNSGRSVSLNDNGNILAIGAPGNDGNGPNSGHVRVFENILGTWTQLGADIDGETFYNASGNSVSLSGSGTRVAIGAPDNNGSATGSGQIRVYNYSGGIWTQIGADIDGLTSNDAYGFSVSLSNDGTRVAGGAPAGNNAWGHAIIYELNAGTWNMLGVPIVGYNIYDQFGYGLSLSGDGNTICIGGFDNDQAGNNAGYAQVYGYPRITPDLDPLPDINAGCTVTTPTPPTATDNCGNVVTATTNMSFPISSQGDTVIVWTYDDGFNIVTQNQFVSIQNNTPPAPDAASLSDVNATCSVSSISPPTATENCTGNSINGVPNVSFPITTQGTTVVTWTYTDSYGNTSIQTQNVILTDATDPVPDAASLPNETQDCSFTPSTPTATDNCAGVINGIPDTSFPITAIGTTVVTWTYDDGNGNSVSQTQNITITDVLAPIPDIASLINDTAECYITPAAPTATDNCMGTITGTPDVAFPIQSLGTTVVTWTFDDGNGNTSTQTQNIILIDTVPPNANGTFLPSIDIFCNEVPTAPFVTDNCDTNVVGISNVTFPSSIFGDTTVTWTFTDQSGNSSVYYQVINILPNYGGTASWTQYGGDIDGSESYQTFGSSVALSADGTTLVAGGVRDTILNINQGVVRVYKYIGGNWIQLGNDISGEYNYDKTGNSVSINDDGTIIAVGAPMSDGNGYASGSVRIFEFSGGSWNQIGNTIYGGNSNDRFGFSVSINDSGTIFAAGAKWSTANGANTGQVRVFENIAGNWVQVGGDVDGEAMGDSFGYSVSLNGAGNIFVAGAILNNGGGTSSGHARIFENIAGNWVQVGNDINGESAGDESGSSVSINNEGTIVAIGAIVANGWGGQARIFQNIAGAWNQLGTSINGIGYEQMGMVSLDSSGMRIAVGSIYHDSGGGIDNGRTQIFEYTGGNWSLVDQEISGEADYDLSGFGVDLNDDGTIVAIGAPLNDGNGTNSGHVRVFGPGPSSIIVPDIEPLPQLNDTCSLAMPTPPTATDLCGNIIAATTTTSFPITTQGTTEIIWEYTDGVSTMTQSQFVVLNDNESPVPDMPFLSDVDSTCSVTSLDDPTATDNCSNQVTVTNDATFPITATTVVTWTFDDGNGNISTQAQNVIINGLNVSASMVDDTTLTADQTGDAYQWIDCDNNNQVITGETNQTFSITDNGNYAVVVTIGNCSDTSNCILINYMGLEDPSTVKGLIVFPNPVNNGKLQIRYNGQINNVKISDMLGRTMTIAVSEDKMNIDVSDLTAGNYLLHIDTTEGSIIKEISIVK